MEVSSQYYASLLPEGKVSVSFLNTFMLLVCTSQPAARRTGRIHRYRGWAGPWRRDAGAAARRADILRRQAPREERLMPGRRAQGQPKQRSAHSRQQQHMKAPLRFMASP